MQGGTRSLWAVVCIVGTSVSFFLLAMSVASRLVSLFPKPTTITHTRDKVVFVDEFLGFNIYLHDRGQFWPGLEMGEFYASIASTFNSKESLPLGD